MAGRGSARLGEEEAGGLISERARRAEILPSREAI